MLLWSSNAEKRSILRERRNTDSTQAVELPDCVSIPERVEEALDCDLLVLALQPSAVRPTLRSLAPHFRAEQLVVHLVKGVRGLGGSYFEGD